MTTAAWIGAGTAAIGAVIITIIALEALRQLRRERMGRRAVGRVVDMVIEKSVGKGTVEPPPRRLPLLRRGSRCRRAGAILMIAM